MVSRLAREALVAAGSVDGATDAKPRGLNVDIDHLAALLCLRGRQSGLHSR